MRSRQLGPAGAGQNAGRQKTSLDKITNKLRNAINGIPRDKRSNLTDALRFALGNAKCTSEINSLPDSDKGKLVVFIKTACDKLSGTKIPDVTAERIIDALISLNCTLDKNEILPLIDQPPTPARPAPVAVARPVVPASNITLELALEQTLSSDVRYMLDELRNDKPFTIEQDKRLTFHGALTLSRALCEKGNDKIWLIVQGDHTDFGTKVIVHTDEKVTTTIQVSFAPYTRNDHLKYLNLSHGDITIVSGENLLKILTAIANNQSFTIEHSITEPEAKILNSALNDKKWCVVQGNKQSDANYITIYPSTNYYPNYTWVGFGTDSFKLPDGKITFSPAK